MATPGRDGYGVSIWEDVRRGVGRRHRRGTLYTHERDFRQFALLDVRDPLAAAG